MERKGRYKGMIQEADFIKKPIADQPSKDMTQRKPKIWLRTRSFIMRILKRQITRVVKGILKVLENDCKDEDKNCNENMSLCSKFQR